MKADAAYCTPDDTNTIGAVVARRFEVPPEQFAEKTSLVEDLGGGSMVAADGPLRERIRRTSKHLVIRPREMKPSKGDFSVVEVSNPGAIKIGNEAVPLARGAEKQGRQSLANDTNYSPARVPLW